MKNTKPISIGDKTAIIREDDCIGCTKCIRVCPVDAILGAAKHTHTVISSECTGCELCIESCPVNCIIMSPTEVSRTTRAEQRFDFREFRLLRYRDEKIKKQQTTQTRKAALQEALLRVQAKVKK